MQELQQLLEYVNKEQEKTLNLYKNSTGDVSFICMGENNAWALMENKIKEMIKSLTDKIVQV